MDLSPADFVLFAIVGSSSLVLVSAVTSRVLHLRAENRSIAHRVVCRLCLHAFEDSASGRTVSCPSCGALNEKGRGRRLG